MKPNKKWIVRGIRYVVVDGKVYVLVDDVTKQLERIKNNIKNEK